MNYERVLGQIAPQKSVSLLECREGAPGPRQCPLQFVGAPLSSTSAAKEIREVTDGRIAHVAKVGDEIDYTAGRSAKEMLMAKLEPRED